MYRCFVPVSLDRARVVGVPHTLGVVCRIQSRHTITTDRAHAGWPVGRPRWPTPPQGLRRTASTLPPIKTQVPWCELLFPPLRRRSHGRRRGFLLLSSLLPPPSSSTLPLNPSKQFPADRSPHCAAATGNLAPAGASLLARCRRPFRPPPSRAPPPTAPDKVRTPPRLLPNRVRSRLATGEAPRPARTTLHLLH
jgi:hypothetical protein